MGMFTEVFDPVTGEYIQFKTGYDDCERYKLGDNITVELSRRPEKSGVFNGCAYVKEEFREFFVVIYQEKIIAVVPWLQGQDKWIQQQLIRLFYNINPELSWEQIVDNLQRAHWYDKLWQWAWPWSKRNKEKRRRIRKIDWKEIGEAASSMIKERMEYNSFAKEIFPVRILPNRVINEAEDKNNER